jgi:hypothetical protein
VIANTQGLIFPEQTCFPDFTQYAQPTFPKGNLLLVVLDKIVVFLFEADALQVRIVHPHGIAGLHDVHVNTKVMGVIGKRYVTHIDNGKTRKNGHATVTSVVDTLRVLGMVVW